MTTRRRIVLTLAALVLASRPPTSHAQQLVDPPWVTAVKDSALLYRVPGMDSVRVRRDMVYKQPPGARDLRFDLYSPASRTPGPHPVIILIHGGPIPATLRTRLKDLAIFTSHGRLLAASGAAAITFEHRLHSEAMFTTSAEDVADLVAHVRASGRALGIDGERICLWAFSYAGPHLAPVLRAQPSYIRCLVASSAVFGVRGDSTGRFSPIEALRSTMSPRIPVFVARAGRDAPWINELSSAFVDAALSRNVQLELHNYAQGVHSFDMRNDTEETRAILAAAVAFVRKHLMVPERAVR